MPLTALSWPFAWHFESGPQGSRTIVAGTQGGGSLAYNVSGSDSLGIEALSVDVDASNSDGNVYMEASLADQAGSLLARVITGAAISGGYIGQATFAPNLPDSGTFFAPFPQTQLQTGLWELEAEAGSTVTVTALTGGVILTAMRLLVFNVQGPSGEVSRPDLLYGSVG